jgi:hypothetical protein
MLTRFALDPDALLAASYGEHKRLLREWERYGVLCHNAASFAESELFGVLEQLPQASRSLWKKMLKIVWMKPAPQGWLGLRGLEYHLETVSVLNGELDLACLKATRFERVQDELSKICPQLELGQLKDIDTSEAFERSHELAGRPIVREPVDDLWNERFKKMAEIVGRVTVVDPYALCVGGRSGLKYFLMKLNEELRVKTTVTIFAAYFTDDKNKLSQEDASGHAVSIRRALRAGGGVGDIKLYLMEHSKYQKITPNRFLRFDHLIVDLGHGIRVFAGDYSEPMPCTIKTYYGAYKTIVKQLRETADLPLGV